MPLDATSDLLIGQWTLSRKLRELVEASLDRANDEVLPALDQVSLMRQIDTSEGVWLDYLGIRLGIRRPATTDPASDPRFGFTGPTQSRGFDQAPFSGDTENEAVYPLPDSVFSRFVKSRAVLVLGDGTVQTFTRAVKFIDPGAAVQDRRDMSVRIITSLQPILELADSSGALPRTAGVRIEYRGRNVFGYDDAGVGFDRGPFGG